MREQDIELFEAIAGNLLSDLGYERMFEAITPETARVARRFRNWWDVDRPSTTAGHDTDER